MIVGAEGMNISLAKLDDLTYRHGQQWTWTPAAMVAMQKLGFDVKIISSIGGMDFQKFSQAGIKYLHQLWTKEAVVLESQHTDLSRQSRLASEMLKTCTVIYRPATITDIKQYVAQGWYVVPIVNGRTLNGRPGFTSHWVLVTAASQAGVTIHNPGLPPKPNSTISWPKFSTAFLQTMVVCKKRRPRNSSLTS